MDKFMLTSRITKLCKKLSVAEGRREVIYRFTSGAYAYPNIRKVVKPFFLTAQEPEQWLFLLGCYNSGTTILRDVLGAHPEIATLPREGVRLTSVFPRPEQYGWTRMTTRCPSGAMVPALDDKETVRQQLISDWAPWLRSNRPVFLEKSISHSARLNWLLRVFPESRFIVIHRDGYSSVEGMCRKARPVGPAAIELGAKNYSLQDCAIEWDQLNRNLLEFSANLESSRIKVVKYESLCDDPALELANLLRFIDVSPDSLKRTGSNTVVVGEEQFEINNMNHKSHSRLSSQDFLSVNAVAGDTLKKLGYFRQGERNG